MLIGRAFSRCGDSHASARNKGAAAMIFATPLWPIDNLSLFMLLIIAALFPLVFIYSLAYVRRNYFRYYFVLLLTLIGMVGTVLAKDLLSFYVFLEIMTVGVYFLIIDNTKKESFPAGYKYILMMFAAGIMILLASLLLYNLAGSFELAVIAQIAPTFPQQTLMLISALFIIGCLIEIGAVPFHIWLPDAHPVAPSPISALLSGLAIKVGAYGIIRMVFTLQILAPTLVVIGVISMLFGVVLALRQTNVKRLLAYHSISQMGYILLGIGAGTGIGIGGALFHILNHAIFKMLLFLCMGAVIYATRERDIKRLGGLGKRMPLTTIAFAFGALAISGIPPFNGFASKALLSAAVSDNFWLKITLILTAAGTLASFYKLFKHVFLGELPDKLRQTREVPLLMSLPMLIFAVACLGVGLFCVQVLSGIIAPAIGSAQTFNFWDLGLLGDTLIIIALGSLIYAAGVKTGFFSAKERSFPAFLSLDRICCGAAAILEKGCFALRAIHLRNINVHLFWMIMVLVALLVILNFQLI
ncbi:MAG: proton-conducting transporter membrane subunit [Candidatus Margulisiibacteriota bacterium]